MNETKLFNSIPYPCSETTTPESVMINARKTCGRLLSCAGIAMLLGATSAAAQSSRESWYFSAAEIGAAYHYQETYGGRMRNPLPAFGCMTGKAVFAATYRGVPVQVSCRFVNKLSSAQLMVALLSDPKLVALYHSAEHLDPAPKANGRDDTGVRRWREQRNVLGFFDGRPLQVLPPHPEGFGVGLPDGMVSYVGFNFLASQRGELMILQGQRAIAFDVSLEMEEPEPNVFGRSLARVATAVQGLVGR